MYRYSCFGLFQQLSHEKAICHMSISCSNIETLAIMIRFDYKSQEFDILSDSPNKHKLLSQKFKTQKNLAPLRCFSPFPLCGHLPACGWCLTDTTTAFSLPLCRYLPASGWRLTDTSTADRAI